MGQGHWKLHQWISHVSIPIKLYPRQYLVQLAFVRSKIVQFATPRVFNAQTEVFPFDDFRKILNGSQRMASVHSGEEILIVLRVKIGAVLN